MLTLDIPDEVWEDSSDFELEEEELDDKLFYESDPRPFNFPRSRLLASVSINGLPCHLEAIAVKDNEEGMQLPAARKWDSLLDELSVAFMPDGGWSTILIDGDEYALFMEPFSR